MENTKDEAISAFAYNTGRMIEELINDRTNNLERNYKQLQARLFTFRHLHLTEFPELAKKFDNYFRITTLTNGKKQ